MVVGGSTVSSLTQVDPPRNYLQRSLSAGSAWSPPATAAETVDATPRVGMQRARARSPPAKTAPSGTEADGAVKTARSLPAAWWGGGGPSGMPSAARPAWSPHARPPGGSPPSSPGSRLSSLRAHWPGSPRRFGGSLTASLPLSGVTDSGDFVEDECLERALAAVTRNSVDRIVLPSTNLPSMLTTIGEQDDEEDGSGEEDDAEEPASTAAPTPTGTFIGGDNTLSPSAAAMAAYARAIITGEPTASAAQYAPVPPDLSAFYVVDLGHVARQYWQFRRLLPRVRPHFAVKCNPDANIIAVLAALGCGFDCASRAEIDLVMETCAASAAIGKAQGDSTGGLGYGGSGIDPRRIVYANPCKAAQQVRYALEKHGVSLMTFDNELELYKVRDVYWAACKAAAAAGTAADTAAIPVPRLLLRIATADHDSLCPLSSKYGAPMEDVPDLLRVARELGVRVVGVAFHVGSGARSFSAYARALQDARTVFHQAEVVLGEPMTVLDIGGGFPAHDGDAPITFAEIAARLGPALEELFPSNSGVDVIAEPGRYFVGAAHTLATQVISARLKHHSNAQRTDGTHDTDRKDTVGMDYYIGDGMYGSFKDAALLGVTFTPRVLLPALPGELDRRAPLPRPVRCTIFGPTCDSLDVVRRDVELPQPLRIGDWLWWSEMGAYTLSLAGGFNGFSPPPCYYVCGMSPSSAYALVWGRNQEAEAVLAETSVQREMERLRRLRQRRAQLRAARSAEAPESSATDS
ncbi:hypothetical protein CDCA_CDCA18G4544 [Cyanidium caldarium]|uniref:ornithine decarboxylase n=1 Tax=Cyanidium caldarium TaxID=2771 RepID=A0AAV9J2H0_CYACA|nr:hypothetical protein CDCA_CDCA18G4544 [Cyanidium caldarium]